MAYSPGRELVAVETAWVCKVDPDALLRFGVESFPGLEGSSRRCGTKEEQFLDFWAGGDVLFPVLRYALELEDLFRWEMCQDAFEKLRSFQDDVASSGSVCIFTDLKRRAACVFRGDCRVIVWHASGRASFGHCEFYTV